MLYPDETIQSQYAASPTITKLVNGLNDIIDPRADISLFFDKIFNPLTAKGVGLDIWGIIVGANRTIEVQVVNEYFGFEQIVPGRNKPFDQAPFWEKGENDIGLLDLADDAFRALIFWKASANIATSDAATLNRLLAELLGATVMVHDLGDCSIRITVLGQLLPYQLAILSKYGLYPKGAAISAEIIQINGQFFGFSFGDEQESDPDFMAPFGQAPFFTSNVVDL